MLEGRVYTTPRPSFDWRGTVSAADLMGAKALAIAGGVVTLLGVVFFFVLAVNRGWIGPEVRIALGGLASSAALGVGFWLRRRSPNLTGRHVPGRSVTARIAWRR